MLPLCHPASLPFYPAGKKRKAHTHTCLLAFLQTHTHTQPHTHRHTRTHIHTHDPQAPSLRLRQVSLWWGNVNVSFIPVLSFIKMKQFIPGEGEKEKCKQWLHSSPVLFHSHACDSLSWSSRQPSRRAGGPALKQISHIQLFDFILSPPSSLLLAYSFFTRDCQSVKVILNQSNPL